MKSSELRIGNYLKNKYEVCIVSTINCDDTIRIFNDVKTQTFGCFALRIFEPIAITDDWLLKAGFKHIQDDWYYNCIMSINISKKIINIDNFCVTDIEFIHQLQNLYFALTGKELTFDI